MIIYLEGPDGSGKTTLANQISEICNKLGIKWALGEPTINTNPIKPDRISKGSLIKIMTDMFNDEDVCYILDRGPISDCIYRLFDEYEPVIELPEFTSFLRRHRSNLLLVYCNNSKAEEFMKVRGDDNPIALAKHRKISYAYDLVMFYLQQEVHYI